jgi:hypothetical protein
MEWAGAASSVGKKSGTNLALELMRKMGEEEEGENCVKNTEGE